MKPNYQKIEDLFKLMNKGDSSSIEQLQEIAKNDPCELVRHEAVFALGEIPNKQTIPFLKTLIEQDPSSVVQHEALVTLGTIGYPEDKPFIENYLNSQLEEVANSADIALEKIDQEEGLEFEIKNQRDYYQKQLLDSKNTSRNKRIQIIFQLMTIGDEKAISTIGNVLKNDPCVIVKHEAGFALGEIGTTQAIQEMAESLKIEKTPIVLHETLFALGTTGKEEALEYIIPFLTNKEYIVAESARVGRDRIEKLKTPYSGVKAFQ